MQINHSKSCIRFPYPAFPYYPTAAIPGIINLKTPRLPTAGPSGLKLTSHITLTLGGIVQVAFSAPRCDEINCFRHPSLSGAVIDRVHAFSRNGVLLPMLK